MESILDCDMQHLENTAINEPPCRPTPPGTGPYVAKKGRGGCPASEALYSGANFIYSDVSAARSPIQRS